MQHQDTAKSLGRYTHALIHMYSYCEVILWNQICTWLKINLPKWNSSEYHIAENFQGLKFLRLTKFFLNANFRGCRPTSKFLNTRCIGIPIAHDDFVWIQVSRLIMMSISRSTYTFNSMIRGYHVYQYIGTNDSYW